VRKYPDIKNLRVWLYLSRLLPEDVNTIRQNDAGVTWLGK